MNQYRRGCLGTLSQKTRNKMSGHGQTTESRTVSTGETVFRSSVPRLARQSVTDAVYHVRHCPFEGESHDVVYHLQPGHLPPGHSVGAGWKRVHYVALREEKPCRRNLLPQCQHDRQRFPARPRSPIGSTTVTHAVSKFQNMFPTYAI